MNHKSSRTTFWFGLVLTLRAPWAKDGPQPPAISPDRGDAQEAAMDQPVIHPNIQQFSRRSLLRRMALVAAAGGVAPLLSACGADTTPSAASTTGAKIGGAIDFLGWEGYNLPDLMKSFDTSHGINFRNTFISTSDDVQAKLMSGASVGYDLTNYYQ